MLDNNKKDRVMRLLILAVFTQISACQTVDIDQSMESEEALTAQTVAAEIASVNAHEAKVQAYWKQAEEAWERGDFAQLASITQALEAYDPQNDRLQQAYQRIEIAKAHAAILEEIESLQGQGEIKEDWVLTQLEKILHENPAHPKARVYYHQLNTKKQKKQQAEKNKKLAFNKPVSMEFRDVDIRQIFEAVAKMTKVNFILDKDIPKNQKATIFVNDMLFNDALDLLLQSNKLAKKVLSDQAVLIYVNDPLRKRKYKDLSVRQFTLNYADPKHISNVLRNMLGINFMEVDDRLNTIIIKESDEVLDLAAQVIQAQDHPDPEVMLEVQLLEVKRSYLRDLGINPPNGISLPVPANEVLTIRDLKVAGNDIVVNGVPSAIFNESNGNVSLLANPRIRVRNRDIANIHIGERVPVFTSNVASTGVATQNVQYIDTGVKLEVSPTISSTRDVTIKLKLDVSSIGDRVTATAGDSESSAFVIGTRETTTTLRLHDGQTQVLAGLIDDQDRQNATGFPGLTKLPILGRLFSVETKDQVKTEIILSITPHIVLEAPSQRYEETNLWIGTESDVGIRRAKPRFKRGESPFSIPRPAPVKQKNQPADEKPKNINIPLPKGFSLGNGVGN